MKYLIHQDHAGPVFLFDGDGPSILEAFMNGERTVYGPADQIGNGHTAGELVKDWSLKPGRTMEEEAAASRFLGQIAPEAAARPARCRFYAFDIEPALFRRAHVLWLRPENRRRSLREYLAGLLNAACDAEEKRLQIDVEVGALAANGGRE